MGKRYAGVVIDLPHPSLDRIFDYVVPDEFAGIVGVGMRVTVPFGIKNKETDGFILTLSDSTSVPAAKLKGITKVFNDDFVLLEKFIPIVNRMREEYHCTYIDAIRLFVPPYSKKVKSPKYTYTIKLIANETAVSEFIKANSKRAPVMCRILMLLMDKGEMPKDEIIVNTWASSETFASLKKKGLIDIVQEELFREPEPEITPNRKKVSLNEDQLFCVEKAKQIISSGKKKPVLLRGVTGSGKTEVYMNITEYILSVGKSVIMLIPEISLTPQTVANFRGRFGDSIAILNSRLSLGERYDEWRRIKNGDAKVVIGARSAIFAPVSNLGGIIIDEEHEDSYKSETSPRYSAFEIARMRSEIEDTLLFMGSATPDICHYYDAENGVFEKLVMDKRVGIGFPEIKVCDMRREIELGNRSMFSKDLLNSLDKVVHSDDQAILLLNRRGFAEHVSCRSCGYVYKCKHCNVSLTYHKNNNLLKCHYCGYAEYMADTCPVCGSKYIKAFGRGTQRLESEIEKFFPGVSMTRMDADTTSTKGAHHRLLKAFGEKQYKILVGTQMVAKGLDFESVVLVGLIAPDMTLNMPEYKSSERVFRLISQASGRAGRGAKAGMVIVQSYEPDHYAVKAAVANDYEAFYRRELENRKNNYYPPFCRIARILFTSSEEAAARNEAENASEILKKELEGITETVVTVSEAPIEKLYDKFRWHVVVRYSRNDDKVQTLVHSAVNKILDNNEFSVVKVAVDFSPSALM